jgi:hypothetical protein
LRAGLGSFDDLDLRGVELVELVVDVDNEVQRGARRGVGHLPAAQNQPECPVPPHRGEGFVAILWTASRMVEPVRSGHHVVVELPNERALEREHRQDPGRQRDHGEQRHDGCHQLGA